MKKNKKIIILFILFVIISGIFLWMLMENRKYHYSKNTLENNNANSNTKKELTPAEQSRVNFETIEEFKKISADRDMDTLKNAYQNLDKSVYTDKELLEIELRLAEAKLSSYDLQNQKEAIVSYKKVINNPNATSKQKGKAWTYIGGYYCKAGRPEEVKSDMVNLIYKDSQFSDYYTGDLSESGSKMMEQAFAIHPTPRAAMGPSHWYAKVLIMPNDFTEAEKKEYRSQAELWLQKANEIAAEEPQRITRGYWHWKAFTETALDMLDGDNKNYRKTYDSLIDLLRKDISGNPITKLDGDLILYSRLFYASFLMDIDNDAEAAKEQLDILVKEAKTELEPEKNQFFVFIKNEKNRNNGDYLWRSIGEMKKVSENFSELVDSI